MVVQDKVDSKFLADFTATSLALEHLITYELQLTLANRSSLARYAVLMLKVNLHKSQEQHDSTFLMRPIAR
jgi:hypothetical protein